MKYVCPKCGRSVELYAGTLAPFCTKCLTRMKQVEGDVIADKYEERRKKNAS